MPTSIALLLLLAPLALGADLIRDLRLEGGGAVHEVRDGGAIRLGGVEYRVSVAPSQTFTCAQATFRIPGQFSLETSEDDGITSYVLDGDNVVVSLYLPPRGTAMDAFVAMLQDGIAQSLTIRRKQVGAADPLTLAGAQVTGTRMTMPVGDLRLHISFYALRHGEQDLLLTIQRGEDEADAREYAEVVRLLGASFRYPEP